MPDKEKKAPVPQKMEFTKGLISDATSLRNDRNIQHHSFMDLGEQDDAEKERIAAGVRNTLLTRMAEENQKSVEEAASAAEEHDKFKNTTMKKAVDSANEDMRMALRAEADALVMEVGAGTGNVADADTFLNSFGGMATAGGNSKDVNFIAEKRKTLQRYSQGQSELYKKFFRREGRSRSARSSADEKKSSALDSASNVRRAAAEWNEQIEKKYHDDTYKARSRSYDRLFMAYYTLSRGNSDDANGDVPQAITDQNAIKKIAEYTGQFADADIDGFENSISNNGNGLGNPYGQYDFRFIPDTSRDTSAGRFVGLNKIHSKVNAEAYSPGVNTYVEEQSAPKTPPRTRFKITNTFDAFLSRKQVDMDGNLESDDAGTDVPMDITSVGLIEDEKGVNGSKLYSQKSARVYTRKTKNGGEVEGFVVAGEFVPADRAQVTASGGYSRFGNISDDKLAEREKVRTAIRRSDFFKHINAASIDYYMKYKGFNARGQEEREIDVERDFMARRAGAISGTSLGQSVINGKLAGFIGGIGGIAVSAGGLGEEETLNWNSTDNITWQSYSKLIGDYTEFQSDMLDFDDNPRVAKIAAATNVTLIAAFIAGSDFVPGMALFNLISRGIGCLKSVIEIFKACKLVSGVKKLGESRKPMLMKIFNEVLNIVQDVADMAYIITQIDPAGPVAQIISIARDVVSTVRNIVVAVNAGIMSSNIENTDKNLKSALDAWKNPTEFTSQIEMDEGKAYSENAQSGMLLKLGKARYDKEVKTASIDAAASALNASSTGALMGGQAGVSLGFKIAAKAASFISFCTGRLSDRSLRKDIIGDALGDRDLNNVSGFSDVLKEETGISNKYYLNDLARVFMAIDMHAMAVHNTSGAGEKELVLDTLQNFVPKPPNMTFEQYQRRLSVDTIIKAVGAPGNWRSVLLESISN